MSDTITSSTWRDGLKVSTFTSYNNNNNNNNNNFNYSNSNNNNSNNNLFKKIVHFMITAPLFNGTG